MAISFNQVAANIRTPGTFIEFNNELAGATVNNHQALIIAQRLSGGKKPAEQVVQVTDPDQARADFGRGSMAAAMAEHWLKNNTSIDLFVLALDDNSAGAAAKGNYTVTGTATNAGTISLFLGGTQVDVGVSKSDNANAIATAMVAAINLKKDLEVTAEIDGTNANQVNVTARHKGEAYNGFDLRHGYYGTQLPDGIAVSHLNLTGGSGNPDIQDAFAVLGDTWFNWFVTPYSDSANLSRLDDELESRWSPDRQIDGRAFYAIKGNLGEAGTHGNSVNSKHTICLPINTSPTAAYCAAAALAAVSSASLSIDPARPLTTLPIRGFKAPASEDDWTREERNTLLYDGCSTFTVGRDGTCRIERVITTYQFNSAGLADASYLDINTPETLSRIRFEQRQMFAQQYPRHKLANDGTNYGAGQAVITPAVARGQLLALYRDMEERGWVEGFEQYKTKLIVERHPTEKNRLQWRDTPDLVNQAFVFAGKQQFIV